ncbi:MAG: hypothetical protein B7X40_07810 [Cellulomonas sp. 14-74-6]|nr:MAG: hypothetical protein B7X40_07810 [Cellulomonas sp. 14-74-6]
MLQREWVDDPSAPKGRRRAVRLTHDLPHGFALNQALSPFAYAALDLLDRDDPGYAHDVVSVIESTLDDPRQVLAAQENKARGEAVAAMKADGLEYDERMALLEDVTYPRPLADLLAAAFATYRQTNPWVADLSPAPKSVVRDLHERAMTFAEYVSFYKLDRTEGVLLRYLADAYRALRQTVPEERRTEELEEIVEWLGDLVRRTDSSLLDEWERLAHPDEADEPAPTTADEAPPPITGNPRVFRALVRGALFRRVELAARDDVEGLAALGDVDDEGRPWDADRWADALEPYWQDHDELLTGTPARGPALFQVTQGATTWRVRQLLDDPEGDHDWRIDALVDLAASDEAGEVRLVIEAVGAL